MDVDIDELRRGQAEANGLLDEAGYRRLTDNDVIRLAEDMSTGGMAVVPGFVVDTIRIRDKQHGRGESPQSGERVERLPPLRTEVVAERVDALAAWAHTLASKDVNVVSWRHSHLASSGARGWSPLDPDDVAPWLDANEYRDLEDTGFGGAIPSVTVDVAIWRNGQLDGAISALRAGGPFHPVMALGQLSDHLATMYAWRAEDAAAFVLCDVIPDVQTADATLRYAVHGGDVDAFSRIEAVLDPALTTEQISEWWGDIRAHLGLVNQRRRRSRKRALMAEFGAEVDRDTESNSTLMAWWNDKYPELQIEARPNAEHHFVRDLKNAEDAVLRLGINRSD